jgi:hypothetical protein
VQRATKSATAMGGVLPRRTVHKDTWSKILALLGHVIEIRLSATRASR